MGIRIALARPLSGLFCVRSHPVQEVFKINPGQEISGMPGLQTPLALRPAVQPLSTAYDGGPSGYRRLG